MKSYSTPVADCYAFANKSFESNYFKRVEVNELDSKFIPFPLLEQRIFSKYHRKINTLVSIRTMALYRS